MHNDTVNAPVMHKTADFNPEMSLALGILKKAHWRLSGKNGEIGKFMLSYL